MFLYFQKQRMLCKVPLFYLNRFRLISREVYRRSSLCFPYSDMIDSVIASPSFAIGSASHLGTYPLFNGRIAEPERFIMQIYRCLLNLNFNHV